MSFDWSHLRFFLAVARTGRLTTAAAQLSTDHATVSRRIAALEQSLAARLFERSPRGSVLTAAGERLLAHVEQMENVAAAIQNDIAGTDLALTGAVRIGAPDGFGVAFLAPRLGALTERHPQLSIQLVPVPRSFSLSRREADIAITVERPTEGRLVAAKLVDYTLGLYASRAYAERNGLPATQGELRRHRLVGYVPDLVISPSLDYGPEILPGWQAHFGVSSSLGQVEAVRAGAGIGILHTFIARAHDDLVPVPAAAPIRRAYWLVYHETVRPLRRVQAVSSFIAAAVEAERARFV